MQLSIVNDKKRFKLARCGRRFGKTVLAVSTLVEEALLINEGLFFYVGPTYKQAKLIAWEMLLKKVRELPPELVQKINESELYVVIGNGTRIHIKGADDPDSLRGVGLDGCVLDEYADIRENVFRQIIEPALLDKKGWCLIIGTPKGYNHFYRLYTEVIQKEDWGVYHFTSYDNPIIDPVELDKIKAETPPEIFESEYLAEFRRFEGLVYKEFDREAHTFQKLPDIQFIETIAGIDWGYTNPTAMVVIKKDFDNNYWIVDEYYQTGKTTDEIIEYAKQLQGRWGINYFYPDNAEPDRIESLQRAGLSVREIDKDITTGIDKVHSLFKSNRLRIQSGLTSLLFELESYRYPKKREGYNDKEEPVKENDHALDALRYALCTNEPTDVREEGMDYGLYSETYS
jgi:PBSX family phage terminase large subunit